MLDYTPTTDDIRASWVAHAVGAGMMSQAVANEAFEDWLGDTIKASHVDNGDLFAELDDLTSEAMSASSAAEDVYYALKRLRDYIGD